MQEEWSKEENQQLLVKAETDHQKREVAFFRNGEGQNRPRKDGQIFNRGILLADMLGASSADNMRCTCFCCDKIETGKGDETDDCVPKPQGTIYNIKTIHDCSAALCNDRFPDTCATESETARGKATVTAIIQ